MFQRKGSPTHIPDRLYGIIGHPLSHTLSPLLHNWGFSLHGLSDVYMAWPLPPDELPRFMAAVHILPIHGVSVTIPHKQAVMPYCDVLSSRAQAVGAVNTLYWYQGALHGENTDVTGFLAPLRHRAGRYDEALVLGAGGAARAVVAGLVELGVAHIRITNRSPEKAVALAEAFGVEVVPWSERAAAVCGLVVNTTPCGMSGSQAHESPLPASAFKGRGLAYDLVYNPLATPFLADAKAAGWDVQDGLAMFVAQGCEQFRLWTGFELPEAEARLLIARALGL